VSEVRQYGQIRYDHSLGILGNRPAALIHVGRVWAVGDGWHRPPFDADQERSSF
jgi:hypothetical protein